MRATWSSVVETLAPRSPSMAFLPWKPSTGRAPATLCSISATSIRSAFAGAGARTRPCGRAALALAPPERVGAASRVADRTMRSTGLQAPRIGVAALNPHGGESGLFGDEEIRIIRPAVEGVGAP